MRTKLTGLALALTAGLFAAGGSPAQDKAKDAKAPSKDKNGKSAPKATPKAPGPITAVVGGDVWTVTRGVVRNGTVLMQDGKILRVGQDVEVPKGATVIDATGKVVTPGFVAISAAGVGIRAGGAGGPGGGGGGPGARPARTTESLNPFDRNLLYCLGAGITTACVDMGGGAGGRFGRSADDPDETRTCPCCGLAILPTEPITPPQPTERTPRRHAVLKMTYGDTAPMLVKETPFYHITAGSLAGPLNRHRWRDTIAKAKQYLKDQAAHEAAGDSATGGPPRVPVSEDVLKLVRKEVPLVVDASSAEQLRDMVALAKELDYNLVIEDAHEAWLVAGDLGSVKASVILTPRNRRRAQPGRENTTGSSIETSAALEKAGVPFAVATLGSSVSLDGIAGRDLTSIALEAAFAVRGGCTEQAALAALTIEPAKMMGLGDRVGSIEVGKDADLLILTGPPLDYRSHVDRALVGGKIYYDRMKDKIYPDAPGR